MKAKLFGSLCGIALLALAGCGERAPLGPAGSSADSDAESITIPRLNVGGSAPGGHGDSDGLAPYVPGQIVVDTSPEVELPVLNGRWGTTTVLDMEDGNHALLAVPPGTSVPVLAGEMMVAGDCDGAEPNWEAESPESVQGVLPFYEGNATPQDVVDQEAMVRIRAASAHALADGSGVVVAIVDTGVDATHPDLAPFMSSVGWDFIDDDADPTDEADGLDQDGDGTIDEAAGHGTHVAGLVHAAAPGATLLAVRVLDSEGLGTSVSVARGIRYAVENGADVVNLSLGMYADASVIKSAIELAEDAGVLVVCAAGNRGYDDRDHFPARLSETVAVAATDPADFKASFSNYSPYVTVSAPGVGLLSTFLDHAYAVWSGTSMSTPLVTGAAALRLELQPWLSPEELSEAVGQDAFQPDYEGLVYEGKMGAGRLDLLGVVH